MGTPQPAGAAEHTEPEADAAADALVAGRGRVPPLSRLGPGLIAERIQLKQGSAEAGGSEPDIATGKVAELASDPLTALGAMQAMFRLALVGSAIEAVVTAGMSKGQAALLRLDPAVLAELRELMRADQKLAAAVHALEPYAAQIGPIAQAKAQEFLGPLTRFGTGFARVVAALEAQLAALGTQWEAVLYELLRSTLMIWDWSGEAAKRRACENSTKSTAPAASTCSTTGSARCGSSSAESTTRWARSDWGCGC